MKLRYRLAAWAWDNLPGGVPAQNLVWDHRPGLARTLESLAWCRDYYLIERKAR